MFATVQQVKNTLKAEGFDLRGSIYNRRTWTDKRRADCAAANERLVAIKFYNAAEADAAAAVLRNAFCARVTRTSVASDYWTRTEGGEYVRTIAVL
jgi:hypothetical protein